MSHRSEELSGIYADVIEVFAAGRVTGEFFTAVPPYRYFSFRCFTRLGTAASAPTRFRRSSSYSE